MTKDIKKKVDEIKERQYADGLFQRQPSSDWIIRGKREGGPWKTILPTPDQLEELAERSAWQKWRKEVNKIPKRRRVLEVPWHIDDVHNIREDLTAEQCAEVLEAVGDNHDAEVGVNWDVISWYAEDLFPEEV